MARGILETILLAGTLVVAIPVAMLGVEFVVTGRTAFGVALLGAAAVILLVHRYVPTVEDLPVIAAEKAAERAVGEDDEP
ncbi:hypothetical protein VB779_09545 [Haloarculaceae archaeon H-GB11]|nr:hypothetical protein [Haloarculaceae archaeon H-GB1-1]MEA5387273.1 hypothetical protein [Haloarculaceae archaeon H-GB11]